jgi:FixJ family two-component response regulator
VPNDNVKPSAAPLVCIVDDDASMADSTRYLVLSFGFRAEAFSSAQEFLNSSLVEEARCLILDMRMPGMDGLELQRCLSNANKRIPIVFVTARPNDSERKQAMAGGAVDFLRKPFSEDALFAAIQAALNR